MILGYIGAGGRFSPPGMNGFIVYLVVCIYGCCCTAVNALYALICI